MSRQHFIPRYCVEQGRGLSRSVEQRVSINCQLGNDLRGLAAVVAIAHGEASRRTSNDLVLMLSIHSSNYVEKLETGSFTEKLDCRGFPNLYTDQTTGK